jgi:hypothetical protein
VKIFFANTSWALVWIGGGFLFLSNYLYTLNQFIFPLVFPKQKLLFSFWQVWQRFWQHTGLRWLLKRFWSLRPKSREENYCRFLQGCFTLALVALSLWVVASGLAMKIAAVLVLLGVIVLLAFNVKLLHLIVNLLEKAILVFNLDPWSWIRRFLDKLDALEFVLAFKTGLLSYLQTLAVALGVVLLKYLGFISIFWAIGLQVSLPSLIIAVAGAQLCMRIMRYFFPAFGWWETVIVILISISGLGQTMEFSELFTWVFIGHLYYGLWLLGAALIYLALALIFGEDFFL